MPAVFAAVGLLAFPLGLFSRRHRRNALLGLVSCAACLISFFLGAVLGAYIRRDGFEKLAERSQALVQAIRAYEGKHGRPPRTMEALAPEFLAEVPKTGMGAYPRYEYVVGERAARFETNPWALYVFTPFQRDQLRPIPLLSAPELPREGIRRLAGANRRMGLCPRMSSASLCPPKSWFDRDDSPNAPAISRGRIMFRAGPARVRPSFFSGRGVRPHNGQRILDGKP